MLSVFLCISMFGLGLCATCGTNTAAIFNRYDQLEPLCFLMTSATDGEQQMLFYPKVDDFTLLHSAGTFSASEMETRTIQLEIGGQVSESVTYSTDSTSVPYFTAVITLDNGIVESITWDSGCLTCEDTMCNPDSMCYENNADCGTSSSDTNCDLKVYVGWFGTDGDGNFVTSASRRLSQFRSYSANSLYDSVLATSNDNIDAVN